MTVPSSEASANSTQSGATVPTELDTVFNPPSRTQWVESALAGLASDSQLESLAYQTLDGINIAVLYDKATANAKLGAPQIGIVNGWDNRLAVEATTDAAQANKRILYALSSGNTSIEFCASAQTDFAKLLNGVMLDVAPLSLRLQHDYAQGVAQFKTYIDAQSMDASGLICSFNADPIGSALVDVSLQTSMATAIDNLGDFAVTTRTQFPECKTVLIDATIHHNAGASATQELHAAIATATLYLEALMNAGLSARQASTHIVFQMACDADVLMGVIKLRSLAHLWQHVLHQFGDTSDVQTNGEYAALSLIVETSQRNQSRIEYWNNHLRNMAACTAAAMGNATAMIVHPHDRIGDWTGNDDSSLGERMARNLPIILDREAGLTQVSDPFAGSHAIETLTSELVENTWQSLSAMSASGGWLTSIQSGDWQRGVAQMHERRIAKLHEGEHIMVGVNRYAENPPSTLTIASYQANSGTSTSLNLNKVRDAETFEAESTSAQPSNDVSADQ